MVKTFNETRKSMRFKKFPIKNAPRLNFLYRHAVLATTTVQCNLQFDRICVVCQSFLQTDVSEGEQFQ